MIQSAPFAEARDQMQAFKHAQVTRYAVGFVRAAMRLRVQGVAYAGSDDVPDDFLPPDPVESPGIAGSAITMLRNAGVIVDYYGTHRDATPPVNGGRRRSRRESANGRKVSVYTLASAAMAESFLRANGEAVVSGQQELAL